MISCSSFFYYPAICWLCSSQAPLLSLSHLYELKSKIHVSSLNRFCAMINIILASLLKWWYNRSCVCSADTLQHPFCGENTHDHLPRDCADDFQCFSVARGSVGLTCLREVRYAMLNDSAASLWCSRSIYINKMISLLCIGFVSGYIQIELADETSKISMYSWFRHLNYRCFHPQWSGWYAR